MTIRIDRITTKTGDSGQSLGAGGKKTNKYELWFMLIGALDELNAAIGMALHQNPIESSLARQVQQQLFDIGSMLYSPSLNKQDAIELHIRSLDESISAHTPLLPPLTSFVIPSGVSATWHFARAIARRAERLFWQLHAQQTNKDQSVNTEKNDKTSLPREVGVFLNRLSDYLFMIARLTDKTQQTWEPGKISL